MTTLPLRFNHRKEDTSHKSTINNQQKPLDSVKNHLAQKISNIE